jgi:hypothetical protein
MKTTILALTLVGLFASGCGSDAVPGVNAPGCGPSNTMAAPGDGRITAFSSPGGGVEATVPVGPASAAPTFTTDGALHIMVNTGLLATSQVLLVDLPLTECVDAIAFTGVQFSISGSLSGCSFGQATQDSAHLYNDGSARAVLGIGGQGAHPNSTVLTASQITPDPQTVTIPFAAQSGGVPTIPTDKSKITWLDWVFLADPFVIGGPTACKADLTITDVQFY